MVVTFLHSLPLRIYYEDTDAGGIVYYANYLKFAERARTEALRALDLHQSELKERHGVMFVVKRCAVDYKRPAKLDDVITVETSLREIGKLRMTMRQSIKRDEDVLAECEVEIACVDETMRPTPIPSPVAAALSETFTLTES